MKIGFTCGAFDLLHAGHVVMFKETKKHCDYLIVGLQTNPNLDRPNKNIPVQSMYERYIQLDAIKYINEIIPYDTEQSLEDLLQSTSIDIRFIGEDYKDRSFTGDYLSIPLHYTSRKHSFSTSGLRIKIMEEKNE